MKIITSLLFIALCCPLIAQEAPGTPLKVTGNTVLTVLQVIPNEGVIAQVDGKNIHGEIVASSGEIFIACVTKGVFDDQVVKPAPAIYSTGDSYSFTAAGGQVRTLKKFSFRR